MLGDLRFHRENDHGVALERQMALQPAKMREGISWGEEAKYANSGVSAQRDYGLFEARCLLSFG